MEIISVEQRHLDHCYRNPTHFLWPYFIRSIISQSIYFNNKISIKTAVSYSFF